MKPTGQLQRTPVDVSLQVQSHPPLFTAQVSEITAHKENAHELPAFLGGKCNIIPQCQPQDPYRNTAVIIGALPAHSRAILHNITFYSPDTPIFTPIHWRVLPYSYHNTDCYFLCSAGLSDPNIWLHASPRITQLINTNYTSKDSQAAPFQM